MNRSIAPDLFDNSTFPTAEDMMPSAAFASTRGELDFDAISSEREESGFDHMDNTNSESSFEISPTEFSARQVPQINSRQAYVQHNSDNRRLHNIHQSFTAVRPPSPSERWRNYLEAARGSLAFYSSTDDIQENTIDEATDTMSHNSSSSSLDFSQTDDVHFSHVRINSPVPTHQIRQPMGIPRFLGGKVCDPNNFKNGERLLKFEVLQHDGSHISSLRGGIINILFKYAGYSETGYTSDTICSLSQIIIKSPERGYSWPCSSGLVFISHKEISIRSTNDFDSFTKESYESYVASKDGCLDDTDPVGFFSLNNSNSLKDIIMLPDRPAKYVLVKLLTASRIGNSSASSNVDLQYVGLVGHSGPRSFAAAMFR
ncbi:hypothetical protein G6F56_000468 [Rhizopus delemar]|nr:hypothetical protein G6F56_000468 [Rhizopus delemar]